MGGEDARTRGLVAEERGGERKGVEGVGERERIVGAVMGVLIGDALGMGVHWYYDLGELRRDYGWVEDYTRPRADRYHGGKLEAGELTQSGEITSYLLEALAEAEDEAYPAAGFEERLDALFAELDGKREGGRHGWTNKDVCDVVKRRKFEGKPFGPATASPTCDTTDSIVRAAVLAARYSHDLPALCEAIRRDASWQYADVGVVGQSLCFGLIVALLVRGRPLAPDLSSELYRLAQTCTLPFTFLRGDNDDAPGYEPDGLLLFGQIARAATAVDVRAPPHEAVQLFGLPCAWYMCLHSAYYLAATTPTDFTAALLNAVNAGGQNVARASLVGALLGAHLGVRNIPSRFLRGLKHGTRFLAQAEKLADKALRAAAP